MNSTPIIISTSMEYNLETGEYQPYVTITNEETGVSDSDWLPMPVLREDEEGRKVYEVHMLTIVGNILNRINAKANKND